MLDLRQPANRRSALRDQLTAGLQERVKPDVFALAAAPPAARFSLRMSEQVALRLGRIADFEIGQPINTVNVTDGEDSGAGGKWCASARLGPDEWLLIAEDADAEELATQLNSALTGEAHGLVDVSHRNVALMVSGSAAADVLNTGCPLDLHDSVFPVGTATRTIFSKCEIVLLRQPDGEAGEPVFRIEFWRSFARYLGPHLIDSAILLGVGQR